MFLFKGNRDYLHSSDITNFICNNYSYNYLDIKFYKPLKTQPNFKLTKRIYNNHKANIVAKIKKNKVEKFLIFYDTANEVKNRENSPLLKYASESDQVIITPHIGGMCREAQEIAYGHAAKRLLNYFTKYNI